MYVTLASCSGDVDIVVCTIMSAIKIHALGGTYTDSGAEDNGELMMKFVIS